MRLPKSLEPIFWDTDIAAIDPIRHRQFVIARIAEKGRMRDIAWMNRRYGIATIRENVKKSRNVSQKTKNFWKSIV